MACGSQSQFNIEGSQSRDSSRGRGQNLEEAASWLAFCCGDEQHDQKQLWEEALYFILQLTVHHRGTPWPKLKLGA